MDQISVSELIVQLTNILAKHGDLKVYTFLAGDAKPAVKAEADTWYKKVERTEELVVFIE